MTEKTILCFGDSLTWGAVPVEHDAPSTRYARDVRWPGVLADHLGAGHHVVEEGLPGRTTTADDPSDPRLNGSTYLAPALASHAPLDLVVVMLGTNDTKSYLHRTPDEIALGMSVLLGQVLTSGGVGGCPAPQALLVAPPPLGTRRHAWFDVVFAGGREKTVALAARYEALARFLHVPFVDAGSVIGTDGADGVHLTEENNRVLGETLAAEVSRVLAG